MRPVRLSLALLFGLGVLGCGIVCGQVPEYAGTDPLASTKGKEVAVLAGGVLLGCGRRLQACEGCEGRGLGFFGRQLSNT